MSVRTVMLRYLLICSSCDKLAHTRIHTYIRTRTNLFVCFNLLPLSSAFLRSLSFSHSFLPVPLLLCLFYSCTRTWTHKLDVHPHHQYDHSHKSIITCRKKAARPSSKAPCIGCTSFPAFFFVRMFKCLQERLFLFKRKQSVLGLRAFYFKIFFTLFLYFTGIHTLLQVFTHCLTVSPALEQIPTYAHTCTFSRTYACTHTRMHTHASTRTHMHACRYAHTFRHDYKETRSCHDSLPCLGSHGVVSHVHKTFHTYA